MTGQVCVNTCANLNATIAGVEYGQECYCGNVFRSGAALASDPTTCSMACAGNSTEACGGSSRLTTYAIGTPTVQPAPVQPAKILNGTWSFLSCQTDNSAGQGRSLSGLTPAMGGKNSLENCAKACQGYQYFGSEYRAVRLMEKG